MGIDPVAFAAAKTPPRMTDIPKWFSHRAYPKAALTKHISGRVVMAIRVGADGGMQPCRIVVSSGSAELDHGSCAIIDKHGPITPALDAAGKPVASWLIMPVRWLNFG